MNTELMRLKEMQKRCKVMVKRLRSERSKIPCGSINLSPRDSNTFFYERNGSTRKGITRDPERVIELARAKYLELTIREYEEYLEIIRKAIASCESGAKDPEEYILKRFEGTSLDLRRVLWTPQQFQANSMQSQNRYMPEHLNKKTNNGKLVRSFSEQIFGNLYEELMIPYWYEKKWTIDVTEMGDIPGAYHYNGRWYKDYYPDFSIPLADGRFKIHEHSGLIEEHDYRGDVGEKMIAYTSSGLFSMEDIILTFPGDVRDIERFRTYLLTDVKPYVS